MTEDRREHRRSHRSRSRSPRREHRHRRRSRSSHGRHHHHKHHNERNTAPKELPYGARQLKKYDLPAFKPMFAMYLDIQKQKILEDMDETEQKGRWKSFIGKWNRGELAEGWYDPETFHKAVASVEEPKYSSRDRLGESSHSAETEQRRDRSSREEESGSEESDASVGPALPGAERSGRTRRAGPAIPNLDELAVKRENESEEAYQQRKRAHQDLQYARKAERSLQKDRLDELVPRAAAGTRERQLEKKREVNEKMKAFREKSPDAAEVPDRDLMGGGDSLAELKRMKEAEERKKSDRELRKEEFLRARAAEREERLAEYREKEDKTMEMLKQLARQRFGSSA